MRSNRNITVVVLLIGLLLFSHCQLPWESDEYGQIQLDVSFPKSRDKSNQVQVASQIVRMTVSVFTRDGENIAGENFTLRGTTWVAEIELEPTDFLTVKVAAFESDDIFVLPSWEGTTTDVSVQANNITTVRVILQCANRALPLPPECG